MIDQPCLFLHKYYDLYGKKNEKKTTISVILTDVYCPAEKEVGKGKSGTQS